MTEDEATKAVVKMAVDYIAVMRRYHPYPAQDNAWEKLREAVEDYNDTVIAAKAR